MNREEKSYSIPNDLTLEILSRLPTKSIGRFRCVSKQWGSMLHKPYFTELFLTRSSALPRILIGIRQDREWSFFSVPQPQNNYRIGKSSSLVVTTEIHIKCSFLDNTLYMCRYASGLLYFPSMQLSCKHGDEAGVICNHITDQFEILRRRTSLTFYCGGGLIGFDPIGVQFKVLSMNSLGDYYILTLGNEKEKWRRIECPVNVDYRNKGVCVNGILYYIEYDCDTQSNLICFFVVRLEKSKFLNPCCQYGLCTTLINYKGKLGVIYWSCGGDDGGFLLELCMWVLEDLEKQAWSKYAYTLKAYNKVVKVCHNISVVGVTALSEIVLVKTMWRIFSLILGAQHL